uniref:Endoplasmin homolog n=1 Tax=Rhizophora mucronata TaxID=61149 RepID=A0A2P2LPL8_RHIMU
MLQQHSSLKTIKKKLIRKALDVIRKIADEDPDESSDKDKTGSATIWDLCNWLGHLTCYLFLYYGLQHALFGLF